MDLQVGILTAGATIFAAALTLIIAITENRRLKRAQYIEWNKYKRELRMNLYIGIIERLRKLLLEIINVRNCKDLKQLTDINSPYCAIIKEIEERRPQWEVLCSTTVIERFNIIFEKIKSIGLKDVNDTQTLDFDIAEFQKLINDLSRCIREELGFYEDNKVFFSG